MDIKADYDKFYALMTREGSECDYLTALAYLSKCLYEYHNEKVIILLDEYDVPLENAC